MHAVERLAPAKINLALAVAPPRDEDGFHPIASWFAPIDLADHLHITRLPEGAASRFSVRWAGDAPRPSEIDWPAERDLGVRALRLLERDAARPLPVSMTLTKRIPVGGGLGGGSSDAAATLMALRDLFHLPIADERLHQLGRTLGSDVPFFLAEPLEPALVEGLGERITRAPALDARFVLILPPFGCPTGAVYRAFDASPPVSFRDAEVKRLAWSGLVDSATLFNDLAPAAESVQPRIADIRRRAATITGEPVHVTGSGSTLFLWVNGADRGAAVARELSAALPDCGVILTRSR